VNETKAIQDYYPDDLSHCYGCGRGNLRGHRLRSFPDGDTTVARFTPEPYHTAMPGYVYGGLIASLIDCHGTGSAAAAAYRAEGREPGSEPALRFVTAALEVDYLAPTPLGPELELRGIIAEASPRKVIVDIALSVAGTVTARGRVVAVRMPESMGRSNPG
jgi:acyl-coenzyme A thioesterase PaaI-like protein